jgi:CubicO group peptidase (beta-lactamase class C family)
MASTGKAYTSIACGIMLQEFKDKIPQGLDTKVFTEKYLPEAFPLDDPRKADITLGQLLCMSAGYCYWGEGQSPTGVVQGKPTPLKAVPGQNIRDLDVSSLRVPLWTDPGAGYSYSSPAPHIASIVLRHVTGMELQDYINERLAKPMGWGPWGYCLHRGDFLMPHANGAGSTAVHATDALRFGYCLLRKGRWGDKQLVPADYIALCNQPLPYNPHTPFSLQFENNSDGHVAGTSPAPVDSASSSSLPSTSSSTSSAGRTTNTIPHSPACPNLSNTTAPGTTGSPFRALRSTKAAWAATMASAECSKWSRPRSLTN